MLYGRSRIFDFAEAALHRGNPPVRPFPIVPLLGPHGAGGTAVLDQLRTLAQDHPGAALDLAGAQDVGSVVFGAVHEFGRQRITGMRRVEQFPRLGVVAAALGYAGKAEDGVAFQKHIRDSLGTGNLAAIVQSWTDRAAPLVAAAVPPDLTGFLATVLGTLVTKLKAKQVDDLVNALGGYPLLKRQTNTWREGLEGEPGERAQRVVDRLLVTAFISDLRADFNHGRPSTQRTSNAFLLLDNCDDEVAVDFLEYLAETRRVAYRADLAADPLLVFAVEHGEYHDDARNPIASTDPELVYVPPGKNERREDHPRLWLPVTLSSLGRRDVQDLIGASPRAKIAQDTKYVLAVTAGHPATTAVLTKLMAELGTAVFDPPGVLERTLPDDLELHHIPRKQRVGTVLDVLLRTLLGLDPSVDPDTGPHLIARLAVCAATDPLDQDAARAVFGYLRWPDDVSATIDVFRSGLWLAAPEDPAASGPFLNPLIGRLLQRWLARFPTAWTEVHQTYADYYRERTPWQYLMHTLALVAPTNRVPLRTVVNRLEKEIGKRSKAQWHGLLDEIAHAPCRLPVSGDPSNTVNLIAGTRDPEYPRLRPTIARLTVAKWLHDDVLMDPYLKLAPIITLEDDSLGAWATAQAAGEADVSDGERL